MPKPTRNAYLPTIQQFVEAGQPAKTTIGKLALSYTPPTAESPAVLAYGRKGEYPTTAESTAIRQAAEAVAPRAIKTSTGQLESGWYVSRFHLHGLGQSSLLPEVQP